ncbi:MAG: hypothetical protein ABH812_01170 [bacterium]
MMTGKQKLYFLLDAIEDARILTPSGQPIVIDPTNDLSKRYREDELKRLFTILEKDKKVLKVSQLPNIIKNAVYKGLGQFEKMDDGNYHIKIHTKFNSYYLKIQQELEYQDFTGRKILQPQISTLNKSSDILFEITYTDGREVLLNKYILIANPDFESENDQVFDYLMKNPRRTIKLEEIEDKIGNNLAKSLHKIIENLGFSGDLRKIFFNVSKNAIYFRNPVTKTDLQKLGMSRIKLIK